MKSKHSIFLDIAEKISEMSHCISHKVGCILVKDGRIISTGYNGTPAGFKNCDDHFDVLGISQMKYLDDKTRKIHHDFSEKFEIHAEINAILCAARNGISIEGSILYTSLHPCYNCLKMICNSGIKTIIYRYEYDKFETNKDIEKMLKDCGVSIKNYSEFSKEENF
jgi:dCMP deaminase